jgi:hypothetical protein
MPEARPLSQGTLQPRICRGFSVACQKSGLVHRESLESARIHARRVECHFGWSPYPQVADFSDDAALRFRRAICALIRFFGKNRPAPRISGMNSRRTRGEGPRAENGRLATKEGEHLLSLDAVDEVSGSVAKWARCTKTPLGCFCTSDALRPPPWGGVGKRGLRIHWIPAIR